MNSKKEQKKVRQNIRASGMTISGWARVNGFSIDTVKNVLYRSWGLGHHGEKSQEIIDQLREDNFL